MSELHGLVKEFYVQKPRTADEIRAMGFQLLKLKGGKFRDVFELTGFGCIVKIPKPYKPRRGDPSWKNPVNHAHIEMDTIYRIRFTESLRHLRKYIPEMHFACRDTGVIVMRKYFSSPKRRYKDQEALLVDIFRESLHKWTADYGLANLMRDEKGNPVVVDLGY